MVVFLGSIHIIQVHNEIFLPTLHFLSLLPLRLQTFYHFRIKFYGHLNDLKRLLNYN